MKLIVAGQDRTADVGARLQEDAARLRQGTGRKAPSWIPPDVQTHGLLHTPSQAAYLRELIRLLRYRDGVDTLDFVIPARPGFKGRLLGYLKRFLWKLLRYQHDRIAFRQNSINGYFASALEYENADREASLAALQHRVAALEARLAVSHEKSPQH